MTGKPKDLTKRFTSSENEQKESLTIEKVTKYSKIQHI